jgi:glutamate:GABA antiporter
VFTLIAFVVVPSITSGSSANSETKIYDVLQAAVTVIWCISITVLFVDILIILRRYRQQFQARRLAHPVVFWACSIIGGLGSLVGIIATLSGSWNPLLISNNTGSVTILGATIAYGTWFWWVGGIAVASLAVATTLYLVGRASAAAPVPVGAGTGQGDGAPGADG